MSRISSGNPKKSQLFADPPPGGRCGEGRDSGEFRPIGRNSARSPLSRGDMAGLRTTWICDPVCRIFRKSRKHRRFADPMRGLLFSKRERPMGITARAADVRRNRHLIGAIRRDCALRGSSAGCREYLQQSPKNLGGIPPSGRNSEGSPFTWRDRAEFLTSWVYGRLCRIFAETREISVDR